MLAAVLARHPAAPALEGVLARSSFLIDGEQAGNRPPESVTLREGAVVEVLPPFAGG
jgi:ThiS family.